MNTEIIEFYKLHKAIMLLDPGLGREFGRTHGEKKGEGNQIQMCSDWAWKSVSSYRLREPVRVHVNRHNWRLWMNIYLETPFSHAPQMTTGDARHLKWKPQAIRGSLLHI